MLADLPFELLAHVVAHLPTAQDIRVLTLTCRRLKTFIDREGWRIFTLERFPSIPTPVLWQDAAHALTTLSKSWDRRSLVARYLEPSGAITALPAGNQVQRWKRPRGQTMGYQPIIDSHSEWVGPTWTDQKGLLAWSAGAELVLRIQQTTERAARQWRRAVSDPHRLFCQNRWFTFKSPGSSEGRDDITSLKLLRPTQYDTDSNTGEIQHIILGRANGDLRRLELNLSSPGEPQQQVYATRHQNVISLDISPSTSPLLATCLGDSRVALYRVYNESRLNEPVSSIALSNTRQHNRLWLSRFLSAQWLAIGMGPSKNPLSIYCITPYGIVQSPLHKFGQVQTALDMENPTSIYAVAPLPSSSAASALPGEVFLSGAFDGKIRLHDLRASGAAQQSYHEPTDDSAVYSLVTLGRERLAAGTARHSVVKFFDLRMTGGRAYHYLDTFASTSESFKGELSLRNDNAQRTDGEMSPNLEEANEGTGWNLFLNPREMHAAPGRGHSTWSSRRSVESPVYSLSMPSSCSPTLFAGVENAVVQLDFASVLDRHPDPVHARGIKLDATGEVDIRHTWNPRSDVLNLAMYERMDGVNGEAMRLKVQQSLESKDWEIRPSSLDERWKDSTHL
ncbi:MAG: hypothetical protein M1821_002088 [Bathelium mastoideum]|nr:MAG: hypothetical protein M1821_002088 [Bathelium mastoideum]